MHSEGTGRVESCGTLKIPPAIPAWLLSPLGDREEGKECLLLPISCAL